MLEKYSEIWDKVRNTKKNGFDSEPIYDEKYLKPEIKFHEGKNEYKFSKEGSQCICLSVILIDAVFRTGKNYYL